VIRIVRVLVTVALFSTLVACGGCGGCGGSGTYRVTGKVVFPDGTPLPHGTVLFNPVADPVADPAATAEDKRPTASGQIQTDGTFKLLTYKDGDGAMPGKYRVGIRLPSRRPGEAPKPPYIDPRFLSSATSGIEVEVKDNNKNNLTINVAPPGQ
jgi:hypothetical protein